jgi:hypothetical protein
MDLTVRGDGCVSDRQKTWAWGAEVPPFAGAQSWVMVGDARRRWATLGDAGRR